jgi:hypothetical protein
VTAVAVPINSYLGIHGTYWVILGFSQRRLGQDYGQTRIIVANPLKIHTICGGNLPIPSGSIKFHKNSKNFKYGQGLDEFAPA